MSYQDEDVLGRRSSSLDKPTRRVRAPSAFTVRCWGHAPTACGGFRASAGHATGDNFTTYKRLAASLVAPEKATTAVSS